MSPLVPPLPAVGHRAAARPVPRSTSSDSYMMFVQGPRKGPLVFVQILKLFWGTLVEDPPTQSMRLAQGRIDAVGGDAVGFFFTGFAGRAFVESTGVVVVSGDGGGFKVSG